MNRWKNFANGDLIKAFQVLFALFISLMDPARATIGRSAKIDVFFVTKTANRAGTPENNDWRDINTIRNVH